VFGNEHSYLWKIHPCTSTVDRKLTDWREQVTTRRYLRGLLYSHSDIVCLLIRSICIDLQPSINILIWVAWLFDHPVLRRNSSLRHFLYFWLEESTGPTGQWISINVEHCLLPCVAPRYGIWLGFNFQVFYYFQRSLRAWQSPERSCRNVVHIKHTSSDGKSWVCNKHNVQKNSK
jgi:hypothetical protein